MSGNLVSRGSEAQPRTKPSLLEPARNRVKSQILPLSSLTHNHSTGRPSPKSQLLGGRSAAAQSPAVSRLPVCHLPNDPLRTITGVTKGGPGRLNELRSRSLVPAVGAPAEVASATASPDRWTHSSWCPLWVIDTTRCAGPVVTASFDCNLWSPTVVCP